MTGQPTAFDLWREGFSLILDAVGAVLLVWLGFQVMFGGSQVFETEALWVGGVGLVAAWLAPGARRGLPAPLVAYVVIAVVSAAIHRWPVVSAQEAPDWWSLVTPASSLMVMAVYVAGAAHLLRGVLRPSLFVVLLAVSILVLATQIMFDRTVTGFAYNEAGSSSLPSVAQWGGLHQTGLLLVIGLPLCLAASVVERSPTRVAAGFVLGAFLLVVSFFNGSRAGIGVMLLTVIGLLGAGLVRRRPSGWIRVALVGAILALPVLLWYAATHVATSMRSVSWSLAAGRLPIWKAAAALVREHPWLGVGPGNYTLAMITGGYAERYLHQVEGRFSGAEQAHNLLIHVAAEVGLLGALCLLLAFGWFIRRCWSSYRAGLAPIPAAGLMLALSAVLLRSMSDNFLDGLTTVDRTRVLLWSLFASSLAVARLERPAAGEP